MAEVTICICFPLPLTSFPAFKLMHVENIHIHVARNISTMEGSYYSFMYNHTGQHTLSHTFWGLCILHNGGCQVSVSNVVQFPYHVPPPLTPSVIVDIVLSSSGSISTLVIWNAKAGAECCEVTCLLKQCLYLVYTERDDCEERGQHSYNIPHHHLCIVIIIVWSNTYGLSASQHNEIVIFSLHRPQLVYMIVHF